MFHQLSCFLNVIWWPGLVFWRQVSLKLLRNNKVRRNTMTREEPSWESCLRVIMSVWEISMRGREMDQRNSCKKTQTCFLTDKWWCERTHSSYWSPVILAWRSCGLQHLKRWYSPDTRSGFTTAKQQHLGGRREDFYSSTSSLSSEACNSSCKTQPYIPSTLSSPVGEYSCETSRANGWLSRHTTNLCAVILIAFRLTEPLKTMESLSFLGQVFWLP